MTAEHQQQLDQEIVDGCTRHPPTDAEDQTAFASTREAIEDEPW